MPTISSTTGARLAVLLAAALVVAACSGGASAPDGQSTPTPTGGVATVTETATPTTTGPLTSDESAWLEQIQSLQQRMATAVDQAPTRLTGQSLRSLANTLRGCAADLSRLAPPSERLRPIQELTERGCQEYAAAAGSYLAAARDLVREGRTSLDQQAKQVRDALAAAQRARDLLAEAQSRADDLRSGIQP